MITEDRSNYPVTVGANYVLKSVDLVGTGLPASVPLRGVHRIASMVQRWLLSTHQGAVEGDRLQAYLKFTFRFNCRNACSRRLLFRRLLCVERHAG